jgi:hypothetical protein
MEAQMASTISTVNESLVDSKVIKALRYVLPMLKSFSHVFEQQGRIKDDVLYVPIATDPTAVTKTAGTMVSGTGGVAGKAVTLGTFSGAGWDCKEGEVRKDLFAEYWSDKIAGAVYGVAKGVVDGLLNLVVKATYGDTDADKLVAQPADFDTRALGILAQKAAVKIKQKDRTLLLNATHGYSLISNSQIGLIYSFDGQNILQTGQVPRIMGMPAIKYDALPSNGENLVGMVAGKGALLLGIAPPDPLAVAGEGDIVERRNITDPESGLTVMYTMTASGGGQINGEVCVLYGVKAGQDAIVRLVSV